MWFVSAVATVTLAGGMTLMLAALLGRPGRAISDTQRFDQWLPWLSHAGVVLAVTGGLTAALAHLGQAAFLLAILGLGFVFQRTHVLRLIKAARCPASRGDDGAHRQLLLALGLWWGVSVLQTAGAWLALCLLLPGA
ncbi:MAG: hypothetical protein D6717_05010 [Gammaproteobacteria bacterium]|nr:MAG: hypothetical protein D6717_05010 [Gammaproteobacteria bacterium]